jgi:hypothetical protein
VEPGNIPGQFSKKRNVFDLDLGNPKPPQLAEVADYVAQG